MASPAVPPRVGNSAALWELGRCSPAMLGREWSPGVAGTPRISWQSRAYSSAGSASVCVCRTWSTLARTICRRLKRPWGEVRGQPQARQAPAHLAEWLWPQQHGRTCIGLARLDKLLQEVLRGLAARAVVLGHACQGLLLPHPVLQHLGRRLHKVPLHVGPTEHSELRLYQAQAGKIFHMLAPAT